jgi:hypothetical protein
MVIFKFVILRTFVKYLWTDYHSMMNVYHNNIMSTYQNNGSVRTQTTVRLAYCNFRFVCRMNIKKVKLSLSSNKHHAVKTLGVLDRGEWPASRSVHPTRERALDTHWIVGWVGPRGGLEAVQNYYNEAKLVVTFIILLPRCSHISGKSPFHHLTYSDIKFRLERILCFTKNHSRTFLWSFHFSCVLSTIV